MKVLIKKLVNKLVGWKFEPLLGRLEGIENTSAILKQSIETSELKIFNSLHEGLESLNEGLENLNEGLENLNARLDHIENSEANIKTRLDHIEKNSVILKDDIESSELKIMNSFQGSLEKFKLETLDRVQDINDLTCSLKKELNWANHRALASSRSLGDAAHTELKKIAIDRNLTNSDRLIPYLAHFFSVNENIYLGRLSGKLEKFIFRFLLALHLSKSDPKVHICEIGTLFGTSSFLISELLVAFGADVELTLIDPLEGFYNQDVPDWGTGLPVDSKMLKSNLNIFSSRCPSVNVRIVKEKSGCSEAMRLTENLVFDFLLIDGDHSFDGVKLDFELYLPKVRAGGTVIFDDYGDPTWPDVKKYVDEHVAITPAVEEIAVGCMSAAYRKF